MTPSTYLLCVSFNDFRKGERIIQQFISSDNKRQAKLLLIENGNLENYNNYKRIFKAEKSVEIFYSKSPNKSKCLNYLIEDVITEEEALIICIDNDIEFKNDFIARYNKTALDVGITFYFGGSMIVPKTRSVLAINRYKNLYQLSQFSKTDNDFKSDKSKMFLGANFAFFKSQWKHVNGFDERFAPGSKYGLAAQESTFQKKMKYAGFKPYFIKNNQITHYPEESSYQLESIVARIENNGFTHGFQYLINSKSILKIDFFLRVLGMLKAIILFKLRNKDLDYLQKKHYYRGYLKALNLYLRIKNKKSIFHNIEKI